VNARQISVPSDGPLTPSAPGEYYQNQNSGSKRSRKISGRLDGDDLIFSKEEGDATCWVEEYSENKPMITHKKILFQ
jgi:hypothetical protein